MSKFDLFITFVIIIFSLGMLLWIAKEEKNIALHTPWIDGTLIIKVKIQSPLAWRTIPGQRPITKRMIKTRVVADDAGIAPVMNMFSSEIGTRMLLTNAQSARVALRKIYALAPNATVVSDRHRVTCYVNDLNFQRRVPGFSMVEYKRDMKEAVRELAQAIDYNWKEETAMSKTTL